MTLSVTILNRDFTTPPIKPYDFKVDKLTWNAAGGCDQGFFSTLASSDRLLEFSSLLRCPVSVADETWEPCWHGYIDQVTITFDNVKFTMELNQLFNRVQVRFSFISPDRRYSDIYQTAFKDNVLSQETYGIRENILYRRNIDDQFALDLRNTFLNSNSFPLLQFSPSKSSEAALDKQQTKITLRCAGWFSTLDWRYHSNFDYYYANHGPGPGSQAFGDGTTSLVGQSFIPGVSLVPGTTLSIKYAYVVLRKVGTPLSGMTALIYSDSGGNPNAILATSGIFAGSTLSSTSYTWTMFTFATPVSLSAGTRYWLVINPNTSSATNHYQLRVDENASFQQTGARAKRFTSSWGLIPNVSTPGSHSHLYFRAVCIEDTGITLKNIAAAGNQFFPPSLLSHPVYTHHPIVTIGSPHSKRSSP
jgi:hypothetical protein